MNQRSTGHSYALLAVMDAVYPTKELICTLPSGKMEPVLTFLQKNAPPGLTVLVKTPENAEVLSQVAPFTASYPLADAEQYYLCTNGTCAAPVSKMDMLFKEE